MLGPSRFLALLLPPPILHLLVLHVLLVDHVFDLSHSLSLLHTVLLPFLVPAPFVDLGFSQAGLHREHEQGLFRPVRVVLKRVVQGFDLAVVFTFTFASGFLILIVVRVITLWSILHLSALLQLLNLSDVFFVEFVAVVSHMI